MVPVFIEGKDPLDERIEFFISKEFDGLEETYYEGDAYPQEKTEKTSRDRQTIDTGEIAELRASPQEPSGLIKSFQRLEAKR